MAADPKAADPGRRELCLSLYTTMARISAADKAINLLLTEAG